MAVIELETAGRGQHVVHIREAGPRDIKVATSFEHGELVDRGQCCLLGQTENAEVSGIF